jgi:hypothetical protein
MKKLITSFLVLGFLSVACLAADPAAPASAPEVQKPACCLKAEKEGKTCQNKCCIKAAKEGKVCEKCLAHSHHKKDGKQVDQGQHKGEAMGDQKHE